MRANRTVWALGVAAALAAGACVKNAATGRRELALVSEEQAAQMGAEAARQTEQEVGLVDDPALQQWVQQVGTTLAKNSERPDIPFRFKVVNDAAVNAFALPGGHIFVTRGILAHLDTEAELASVLGHEIGHVTAAHSIEQISKQELMSAGLGLGVMIKPELAPFAQIAQAGLGLLLLKYGRDAETEADALGFRYASKSNYDPAASVALFQMLSRVGGGGGRLPDWLSTHPNPEDRLKAAQQRLAEAKGALPKGGDDRAAYLKRIEGLPFGTDPKNGYFEGQRYIQPQLAVELTFPQGWKTQDTPQAVQGASADGNAAVMLTVTQEPSPEAAMQKFGAIKGISIAGAQAAPLNAMPAMSSRFTAQSQEGGSVAGLVSFVRQGNRTFQLVGIAKPEVFQQAEPALRGAFETFKPVTDDALLHPKTPRVRIVALPSAMTLTQFNQQQPSSVSIAELAVVNGVKPDQPLEAGRLVKRIVPE